MERKLEVIITEVTRSKITVNTDTGRLTLKLPLGASVYEASDLTAMAMQLMTAELPPYTLRGRIYWNKEEQKYGCLLMNDARTFKYHIEQAPITTRKDKE